MLGFYLLLPTLFAILISCLIVRAAAIALMITGMEEDMARFQARSAFTGTGFTTKAAEPVVNHPLRRKIVSWLMLMGHVGIVTVIITATSSLANSDKHHLPINAIVLAGGAYVIYLIVRRNRLMQRWENFIRDKLGGLPAFKKYELQIIVHLMEGCAIMRLYIEKASPLVEHALSDTILHDPDMFIIGIERGDLWLSRPKPEEQIKKGDNIILYGCFDSVRDKVFTPHQGKR
jgi:hypothetical protein